MSATSPVRPTSAAESASLEVRLLGAVDFESVLQLQDQIVYELSGRSDRQGALLLCEHPPLISIGREGSRGQVRLGDDELAAHELQIHWVSRSGGAWMHAPGQLAVYPLLPLDRLRLGLAEYRDRVEEVLLDVCHELRAPAKRIPGNSGIWGRSGQVGAFGAAVRSWVTQHGAWLNVNPEPSWLRIVRSEAPRLTRGPIPDATAITPADVFGKETDSLLEEGRVSSLQEQLRRRLSMSAVREAVIRRMAAAFGYQTVHTYTGHPALVRCRVRVCQEV